MSRLAPLPPEDAERCVGLTTTVPVEALFAAGLRPVDLNNVFITSGEAGALVDEAERRGFPANSCAWTKGVYATARRLGLRRVVAVLQGDCSNSHAMAEVLQDDGVEVVPFAYPYDAADTDLLAAELRRFAERVGVSLDAAEAWKRRLDDVRSLVHLIDRLAWQDGRVTGGEQHVWTISCSDFMGDPEAFADEAGAFIEETNARDPLGHDLRLALIGIPPICEDFFDFLEQRGARVVYNEIPRQFAMPDATATLVEQYSRYTYPYDVFRRIDDIREQVARRHVHGVIHYVQSFCHRLIEDAIVRARLDLPLLTLEGDRPGPIDARTETRIEAFLELVRDK